MKSNLTLFAIISLCLITSVFLTQSILAEPLDGNSYGCNFGGMMYGNYGYGSMYLGWIVSLLITVTLILFIVWLIKQIQKK